MNMNIKMKMFRAYCLLAALSICQGGNTFVTVSDLPARRGVLCMPARSVCFWPPRLLLVYPGYFTSVHVLKCTRTQKAPLFNAPRGRRRNRGQVSFPRIHRVVWLGVELTTLGL